MLCLLLVIKPNNIVFHRQFYFNLSPLSLSLSQAGTDIVLAAVNSDGRGGVSDR